jgi:nitrate/nitrite transporter NarK
MSASAIAGVIGGPLAGGIMTWAAGAHGMHGWQWLFIIEGIPSVLAGVFAYFYMTDRPEQARWLSDADRAVVRQQLELDQKAQGERHSDWRTLFGNPMVWLLIAVFFCLLCANSTLTFWIPTVIREAGFTSPMEVGWIAGAAYLLGAAGMVFNGRHSDHRGEVRWHFAGSALLGAGGMLALAITMGLDSIPVVVALTAMVLALVGTMSAIPVFWQMPNMLLSGGAAAVGVALINSVANLAGFGAPYLMGVIKASTGKVAPGLYLVAVVEVLSAILAIAFIARIQRRKDA